ncbi:MAG TPA: hypothetical protein PLV03_07715, partial [Clostridiales bacterium]|nr:hypothetical protein [Clostridiales bacterium]
FPHRTNNVVAIDGFLKREWLLRAVGCIGKRKFTNDVSLIRNLMKVIKNKNIAVVYPEARYSLCGTNAILPGSLGKLVKLLGVDVVTLITKGHHIDSPFWHLGSRGVQTEAHMTRLISKEELGKLTAEEINGKIERAFFYDDFAWQKQNGVRIINEDRAEGLHKVLYQCPHCKAEYQMDSKGSELICKACGKVWEMSELGELKAKDGETEFTHIPDWYEWEREQVRAEIEEGRYCFSDKVIVQSLPNTKGYIELGLAEFVHNMDGFTVKGEYDGKPFSMEKSPQSLYSCHIEYEYLGKFGDCVDLNTLKDTWYCYPQGDRFSVTKIALATEEMYKYYREKEVCIQPAKRISACNG